MEISEFEIKIQKMLQDTVKGLATKEELKTAINEEVAKKMAEDEHIKETQTAVEELRAANDNLVRQVKQLVRTRLAAIKAPDGMYNGVWGSLETAKNFGLFVLAEIGNNQQAKEQLDALGIERKYILGDKTKAMGEDVLTTGGALVPTEFIPNLIVLMESYGVFRRNAQEWPMSSDSSVAPELTSDVTVYCPGAGVQSHPQILLFVMSASRPRSGRL